LLHTPHLTIKTEHRSSIAPLGRYLTFTPLRELALEELTKVKLPSSASDFFDRMAGHARALSIQEHTVQAKLAHTLADGNWSLSVDGGIGASLRHLWLADPHRAAVLDTMQTFKRKKETKRSLLPRSNRGPRLPLTPWHAQAGTAGFHDTLCTFAYNLKSAQLGTLSSGIQVSIPTGTLARQRATDRDDGSPPLAAHPFALQLTNRVRDILLAPPLGSGHWGVGLTCQYTLPLGSRWDYNTSFSVLQYLPAEERRYELDTTSNAVPFLFEGIAGTEVGISPDEDITQHIRQHLYPSLTTRSITPGTIMQGQIGIGYGNKKWHGQLLYRGSWQSAEYSTQATAQGSRQQHSLVCGIVRKISTPGISSWHITATVPLSRAGDGYYWSISFGLRE
jgi:hypothetical protein